MKFKAIELNGKFAVVSKCGYVADDEIETLKEAKKIAKWMTENN